MTAADMNPVIKALRDNAYVTAIHRYARLGCAVRRSVSPLNVSLLG
jgi:hypothetical protein